MGNLKEMFKTKFSKKSKTIVVAEHEEKINNINESASKTLELLETEVEIRKVLETKVSNLENKLQKQRKQIIFSFVLGLVAITLALISLFI